MAMVAEIVARLHLDNSNYIRGMAQSKAEMNSFVASSQRSSAALNTATGGYRGAATEAERLAASQRTLVNAQTSYNTEAGKGAQIIGGQLTNSWKAMAGAAGLALGAFALWDTIQVAARAEEMYIALDRIGQNVGLTSKDIRQLTDDIRAMGIQTDVAQYVLQQFVKSNLDVAKASELARVAQNAAIFSGMDSSQTLRMLIYGIQTYQTEIFRTAGLNVNVDKSFGDYARTLGKARTAMSETERQTAVLNAVIATGATIAGAYEAAMSSGSKQLRSFPRYINDLQMSIGGLLNKAFTEAVFLLKDLIQGFEEMVKKGGALRTPLEMLATVLMGPIKVGLEILKAGVDIINRFSGVFSVLTQVVLAAFIAKWAIALVHLGLVKTHLVSNTAGFQAESAAMEANTAAVARNTAARTANQVAATRQVAAQLSSSAMGASAIAGFAMPASGASSLAGFAVPAAEAAGVKAAAGFGAKFMAGLKGLGSGILGFFGGPISLAIMAGLGAVFSMIQGMQQSAATSNSIAEKAVRASLTRAGAGASPALAIKTLEEDRKVWERRLGRAPTSGGGTFVQKYVVDFLTGGSTPSQAWHDATKALKDYDDQIAIQEERQKKGDQRVKDFARSAGITTDAVREIARVMGIDVYDATEKESAALKRQAQAAQTWGDQQTVQATKLAEAYSKFFDVDNSSFVQRMEAINSVVTQIIGNTYDLPIAQRKWNDSLKSAREEFAKTRIDAEKVAEIQAGPDSAKKLQEYYKSLGDAAQKFADGELERSKSWLTQLATIGEGFRDTGKSASEWLTEAATMYQQMMDTGKAIGMTTEQLDRLGRTGKQVIAQLLPGMQDLQGITEWLRTGNAPIEFANVSQLQTFIKAWGEQKGRVQIPVELWQYVKLEDATVQQVVQTYKMLKEAGQEGFPPVLAQKLQLTDANGNPIPWGADLATIVLGMFEGKTSRMPLEIKTQIMGMDRGNLTAFYLENQKELDKTGFGLRIKAKVETYLEDTGYTKETIDFIKKNWEWLMESGTLTLFLNGELTNGGTELKYLMENWKFWQEHADKVMTFIVSVEAGNDPKFVQGVIEGMFGPGYGIGPDGKITGPNGETITLEVQQKLIAASEEDKKNWKATFDQINTPAQVRHEATPAALGQGVYKNDKGEWVQGTPKEKSTKPVQTSADLKGMEKDIADNVKHAWGSLKGEKAKEIVTAAGSQIVGQLENFTKHPFKDPKTVLTKAETSGLWGQVNAALNSAVFSIKVKGVTAAGGLVTGAQGIAAMANGGFVNKPTVTVVGEAGPEIVLPLSRPSQMQSLLRNSGHAANIAQAAMAVGGLAGPGGPLKAQTTGGGLTAAAQQVAASVTSEVKGARVSSGFRPGSITKDGNLSQHALGMALDFVGPLQAIFDHMVKNYARYRLHQLIYQHKDVYEGKLRNYARSDHFDHVHAGLGGSGAGANIIDINGRMIAVPKFTVVLSNRGGRAAEGMVSMARGGMAGADSRIHRGPVRALIGEAGPEMVLPLSRPREMATLLKKSGHSHEVLKAATQAVGADGITSMASGGISEWGGQPAWDVPGSFADKSARDFQDFVARFGTWVAGQQDEAGQQAWNKQWTRMNTAVEQMHSLAGGPATQKVMATFAPMMDIDSMVKVRDEVVTFHDEYVRAIEDLGDTTNEQTARIVAGWGLAGDALSKATKWVGSLGSAVSSFTNLTSNLGQMMSGASAEKMAEWADGIRRLRDQGLAPRLLQQLVEAGPSSFGTVRRLLSGGADAISNINRSVTSVESTMTGLVRDLGPGFAQGMSEGVAEGIVNQSPAAQKAAADFVWGLVDRMKEEMGIKSPSTVTMASIGSPMVEGIVAAFASGMPRLQTGMQAAVDGVDTGGFGSGSASGDTNGETKIENNFYVAGLITDRNALDQLAEEQSWAMKTSGGR